MQFLCKVSTPLVDVRCPVCSQGFLVYWTRQRANEREEQRAHLEQFLYGQHGSQSSAEVHAAAFRVAEAPGATPKPALREALLSPIPVYS